MLAHPLIPVILSGGSGTRLWPLSRANFPKQFLGLTQERTLFQLTLDRLRNLSSAPPLVIGNEAHRFILAEQLRQADVQPGGLLLEPEGKNTALAIGVAAVFAMREGADPLLLVLPADHVMQDTQAFHRAVAAGVPAAQQGAIITFGVVPVSAATGYGYLRVARASLGDVPCVVQAFVEKPDAKTAQSYLEDGCYFWNGGMFLFRASVMLAELRRYRPDIEAAAHAAVAQASHDLDFTRLGAQAFCGVSSESIDYAVMENSDLVQMVPLDAGWSDVGAWDAVWQAGQQDGQGNVLRGDVLVHGTHDSYIHAKHRLVGLVGVNGLVVVETADAVLVASKQHVQDVKKIVEQLVSADRCEAAAHRQVFRPWGSYDLVDRGERYQVKRITVQPGHKLSVQMHHHRAEHWIVVSGTAKVQLGEQHMLLTENQSTYIPVGVVHALENPGKIPLELIEVQSGAYLGEDDIVRLDDCYGRHAHCRSVPRC
ncbi:mannose-1-phosphate guanylyltransferase/mannose-6-phosphate isomerase [Delftia sp. PS-11]|uniref:mannose-1-phosphate guanylyltransferase/mannose-6-phosphate isomerase n=1 Tax=Delftia sp. PS-11 TaxID=2767222 RepID=UPI002453F346|nr:mannose-1-phosphate guanylyltransferase/mannose-6-phosphate isomerase [Delftia sp. PS-11]KAJ8743333.1 mannose-1-phosphate guanylyltransferase/mannose-6-phosphate isomerase [Delftia sp. PS-11]